MRAPLLFMTIAAILSVILSYIIAILAIAFYTLIERKFLGYFHLRKGPNKVGLMGIPQPFADAIKLFVKEQAFPVPANRRPFIAAPILGLILALIIWAIFPHSNTSFWIQFGVLYFLCVSRINVYSTFLAGWCSNSKYALLGALRGVAQTISYEVRIALILLRALLINLTLDFSIISNYFYSWVIIICLPIMVIWFITNLAETNRTPFDFAEGESELVSGFNVEYRRGIFALIFIAEYANILVISLFTAILFIGALFNFLRILLLLKTLFISVLFVWVRATLPRIRYDFLIMLTWKSFLPFALAALILILPVVVLLNWPRAGWTDNSDDVKYG